MRKTSVFGMLSLAVLVGSVGVPFQFAGASAQRESGHVSTTAGLAHARQQLAKFSKPFRKDPTAGPPISGVATLKGKTAWYVPIVDTSPWFAEVGTGVKEAVTKAGMVYHLCSGEGTPSGVASCLNQAVSSGAAGIFTTSISYGFAASAFTNAKAHHVPVVFGSDGTKKSTDQFAYVTPSIPAAAALAADWVIANSNGHAHVLLTEVTTTKAAESYITTGALPEFAKYCAKCSVNLEKFLVVNLNALSSLVSTGLADHPTVNYIFSEFDTYVTTVFNGIVSPSEKAKLRLVAVEAIAAGMQRVAGGTQGADVAISGNEFGWTMVDQLLRMTKHMHLVSNYHVGMRVFTSANVGTVPLTVSAQNEGDWVGPTAPYKKYFENLWK